MHQWRKSLYGSNNMTDQDYFDDEMLAEARLDEPTDEEIDEERRQQWLEDQEIEDARRGQY